MLVVVVVVLVTVVVVVVTVPLRVSEGLKLNGPQKGRRLHKNVGLSHTIHGFQVSIERGLFGGCSSNGGKKPSMEIDGIRSLLPYESSAQIVSLHAH